MDFTDMDMDTGFFSWIISANISVPENFMDMDMDMPNFHGYYPWRALIVGRTLITIQNH